MLVVCCYCRLTGSVAWKLLQPVFFQFFLSFQNPAHREVPCLPVFDLAHSLYARDSRLCEEGIYVPAVYELVGQQAVMVDDFVHASVYEHVAYGHQTAGMVDVFPYQVVSQIPDMECQQQPPAPAGGVIHPFAPGLLRCFGTPYHQVTDMYRREELALCLLSSFGRECHVKVSEWVVPAFVIP